MTSKSLVTFLACVLILTTATIGECQTKNPDPTTQTKVSDWQALQNLKRGQKIFIEYKSNVGGSLESSLYMSRALCSQCPTEILRPQ